MIKIDNTEVFGFEAAIRGMRNPMNSWNKSDSGLCRYSLKNPYCYTGCHLMVGEDVCATHCFTIGDKDMELAKNLVKAGSDHRKFLRMIHVQADILAPMYWWKHLDQYKVATTTNSTSTMHTIHKREFTLDDFSTDNLMDSSLCTLEEIIERLNFWRIKFIEQTNPDTKNDMFISAKSCWWQIIQLLPSSYNQLRTIDLNYEVLYNIYFARKNHKLDEWHTFCEWIEQLPYMKEFLGLEEENE